MRTTYSIVLATLLIAACAEAPSHQEAVQPVTPDRIVHDGIQTPRTGAPTPLVEPPSPFAARLLAPLSTSISSMPYVSLRFEPAELPDGLQHRVEVCADRGCELLIHADYPVTGESWADAYDYRTAYWRVQTIDENGDVVATSATWQFHTRPISRNREQTWGSVADFDGDGLADALIGDVPQPHLATVSDRGRAHVYLSADQNGESPHALVLENPAASDDPRSLFGSALTSAGDLNGDGYADLAVGARCGVNCELLAGRVHIYFGSSKGIGLEPSQTLIPPGASGWTDFGAAISTAGDLNGDGYADLLVGAPDRDRGGHNGEAHIYYGGPGGVVLEPGVTINPGARHSFGSSVLGGINIDSSNGELDLIIGAPSVNGSPGEVYVYSNGSFDEPAVVLMGDDPSFGESLASVYVGFDIAVAVGEPLWNDSVGAVTVYRSPVDGWASPDRRTGESAGDLFGASLAGVNDWTQNGVDELMIGVPGSADGRGHVEMFDFMDWGDELVGTLTESSWTGLGTAVGAADLDGNGVIDLMASTDSGTVVVYEGPMTTLRRAWLLEGEAFFGTNL